MLPEIDAVVRAQIAPDAPGVAVAVVKDGDVIHSQGYGLAELEWGCAVTPDTVFCLTSLTKPFTAGAIMLLERDGLLRLSDPVASLLPDYQGPGREVTLAQLLTHTSGIPNYVTQEGFWDRRSRLYHSPRALRDLFEDLPLDFAPGTRYRYSNSAYCLLGLIIEAVAGMSYAAFIETRIFAPLGMTRSYYMHDGPVIPRRARGYRRADDGAYAHASYLSMSLPYAAGALGSTIGDLVRWDAALRTGTLLDQPTQAPMYAPVRLADGHTRNYGLGWGMTDYRGGKVVHHAGGARGFSTFYGRFLDDDLTIIILANLGHVRGDRLARRIAAVVAPRPAPAIIPGDIARSTMERMAGVYDAEEGPVEVALIGRRLVLEGQRLRGQLIPLSETACRLAEHPDITLQFEGDQPGPFARVIASWPFHWTEAARHAATNRPVTDDTA